MFCTSGLIFGGNEGVESRFYALRSRNRFRRYRGRRVLFSCFALSDSFSVVPRSLGPFSCFTLLDSFSAVPRASGPVFMFCAPELSIGSTVGIVVRFPVLRAQTCFRRYRRRQIPFSSFLLPDMFSGVPRAKGPFFMFCVPGLIFGGIKGVDA
jgi:hypothetical protein